MPISKDVIEKTKDNYLVYSYQYSKSDRHSVERIEELQREILSEYKKLGQVAVVYIHKKHPILALWSEKKVGLNLELRKLLDAGSIVEWTSNQIDDNGNLRRPKSVLYVERRSDLSDATGYMEEQLKWTVDLDFGEYIKLECLRVGNTSILKLTGRDIEAAQKEFEEKRKKKK